MESPHKTDALVRLVRGLIQIPEVMLLAKHCRKFKRGYCFGPDTLFKYRPRGVLLCRRPSLPNFYRPVNITSATDATEWTG